MQKSSLVIAASILVVATVWVLSGSLSGTSEQSTQPAAPQPKDERKKQSVLVQRSTAKDFTHYLSINGRSQASRSVILKAEVSAQVDSIVTEKGHAVEAGDIVATLKEDDRESLVKEAQQRLNQRQIEYNAALKLKKDGFNSNVRVAEARAELESARATLERAQLNLHNTKIVAPFAGIIDRQYVEIGDFLNVGQDLVKIVDLDPIEFEAFAAERNIQDIREGAQAIVTLIDGTDLTGSVSYVAVSADEDTRTFPVEISVANPDHILKEGMTVGLQIPLTPQKAHKIAASTLVLNDDGQVGIRSVKDNRVAFHPVHVLASEAEYSWVAGLDQTVDIIIQGQSIVTTGQEVIPTMKEQLREQGKTSD